MAIVAALALGVGVTGTMLWVQSRPASPVAASSAAPGVARIPGIANIPGAIPGVGDAPAASNSHEHPPPAELTAGMTKPQAALTLGNWHYDHEKWDLALENYRRAIAGGLDNPDVRTDMGNALRFAGQPQKALEQYQIAQKQNPAHEQSLFNQGALYAVSLSNPKKGIAAWRAYLKRFPGGQSASQARQLIAQFAGQAAKGSNP